MKLAASAEDLQQIRMALERTRMASRFRALFFAFWGLIVAKCVLAEYAIRAYEIPVNSIFVWAPTLAFGLLCTIVYSASELKEMRLTPQAGQYATALWAGIAMALALLGVVGVGAGVIPELRLPAISAVILGVGFFAHAVLDPRIWFKVAAFGWWAASIPLFVLSDLSALFWFGIFLILLQVIPGAILAWKPSVEGRSIPRPAR